jgi:chorismate mutase/prephenate dehydrogenase
MPDADAPGPPAPPDLAALRAEIDTVDHEILQALARRNGLVAKIAACKRAHGLRIRDHRRERELLADRRDRATPLGLSPEVIESVYRLVLWASRDRQAALRAELPPDVEPRTVGIIGARGGMGRLLTALFADLGHHVLAADVDTDITPRDAAAQADVVVISVPIEATLDVIRDLGPRVREDALLMDVTSIKAAPVEAMLRHAPASVIGTHPLFGPSVHSVQGQRIVLTPARLADGTGWLDWLRRMLEARGLQVIETSPDEHDRAMAVVQVLTHFSTEVLGRAIASIGVPLEETLRYTSPVYLIDMLMAARHFAQSPDLYASIQMSNPRTAEVTAAFVAAAQELRDISVGGDRAAFAGIFRDVAEHFGDFTGRALEQSSYLIDRLVERT